MGGGVAIRIPYCVLSKKNWLREGTPIPETSVARAQISSYLSFHSLLIIASLCDFQELLINIDVSYS